MAHDLNPPVGFDQPTKLPSNADEKLLWQEANKNWWEQHPMRYDWRQGIVASQHSPEFFNEIDERFFDATRPFMPWRSVPFDPLIDFESLRTKDVLEIGVGCGSHAGLLARYSKSFVGIDLTEYAVSTTSERLKVFGLNGKIKRMDAEALQFETGSFDFIWTWGVIHHSSDTAQILQEMSRVLRPGGTAVTMVYNRGFWTYYVCQGLLRGLLTGELLKRRSLHNVAQTHTDGAIARYFTADEWRKLTSKFFRVDQILVYGAKAELIPLPGGMALKSLLLKLIPDSIGRFLTNRMKMGSFLVAKLTKV